MKPYKYQRKSLDNDDSQDLRRDKIQFEVGTYFAPYENNEIF